MKHGVLRDALVEVSETKILLHWIGLKKLAYKNVNYNIVCALYSEIPGRDGIHPPPQPILNKNSPTELGLTHYKYYRNANTSDIYRVRAP